VPPNKPTLAAQQSCHLPTQRAKNGGAGIIEVRPTCSPTKLSRPFSVRLLTMQIDSNQPKGYSDINGVHTWSYWS
jgi:hypothetical protein